MAELSDAQMKALAMFGPMDGEEIPDACSTCDATVTVKPMTAGVWQMTVAHDPGCPTLARRVWLR